MFIHYSDSNIREKTLLEVLQSPLFIAYHDSQPFNENHLRPCPMLENPELLREMIAKVGGFPFYKHPKTLHRPKGSSTNPQGIYLVEKRTLQNAKSFFLSYLNTIDFRTPDLKITMCETTLQSLLRFLRIISRLKLQQPVIFRQHLHLTDGNGVEFCQTL